jgi:hypothetical protein
MKGCSQSHTGQPEPRVGIFWLIGQRLIIDTTPVSKAEAYSTASTHPTSHIDYWTRLQRTGAVPPEVEYEELPRGRVVFDGREQRFTLYADVCILRKKSVVKKLLRLLHLPDDTALSTDRHYRCSRCVARRQRNSTEDE